MVIEPRAHADKRGAKRLARLSAVLSERSRRRQGDVDATLSHLWDKLPGPLKTSQLAIISGATGAEPATGDERAFLARHADVAVRAPATYLGHALEPQFPMNVALATLALSHGKLFP